MIFLTLLNVVAIQTPEQRTTEKPLACAISQAVSRKNGFSIPIFMISWFLFCWFCLYNLIVLGLKKLVQETFGTENESKIFFCVMALFQRCSHFVQKFVNGTKSQNDHNSTQKAYYTKIRTLHFLKLQSLIK